MTESRKPAVHTVLEIGEPGSAFSIAVEMKKIRTSSEVSLDTASPSGNPIKQQYVDLSTGEIVPSGATRKGIFRSKPKTSDKATWGDFCEISRDDLALIEDATSLDTLVVDHFIPLAELPKERITDAYYIATPSGSPSKPLVLLARAMKKQKVAGVFKMTKSTRQYLAVIYEQNDGLIVNTLSWSADFTAVRDAATALQKEPVKISAGEQKMAETLLAELTTGAMILDTYEDDLLPLRADLIARAIQGKTLPKRQQRALRQKAESGDLEVALDATVGRVKKKASPPSEAAVVA